MAASALPSEHKSAFDAYMRSGDDRLMRSLDAKAMSYGSAQDGGYLVPDETEAEIGKRLAVLSPIRAIAVGAAGVGGGAEEAVLDLRSGGRLGRPRPRRGRRPRRRRWPSCSSRRWSSTPCRRRRPRCWRTRWSTSTSGSRAKWRRPSPSRRARPSSPATATNKPKGFLDYTKVAEASWVWGEIGYIVTGVSGALPASHPSDMLIDTVYALKAGYRQNANWVMNRKTQACDPQAQGCRRQLSLAAAGGCRPARDADGLSAGRGRGHAGRRRQRDADRVRRFRARLSGRRPDGRAGAARSRIPPSPTCCSTRPSASAAACRISTRSS